MRSFLPWLALGAVACAEGQPPKVATAEQAATGATVTVRVNTQCSGCQIDGVAAALDGEEIAVGAPVTAGRCGLPLSAQEHELRVVADVSTSCGGPDEGARSSARIETWYDVTLHGSAVVDVNLVDETDGVGAGVFGDHLRARWVAQGAQLAARGAEALPSQCFNLDANKCAECRVVARHEAAVARADVLAAACLDEKLLGIRAAMDRADTGDGTAAASILRLEREAGACATPDADAAGHTRVSGKTGCVTSQRESLSRAPAF